METKLQLNSNVNEAFLRMTMESKKSGPISISRQNEIGKYICSFVRYSNLPVRQSSGTIIHLPDTTFESGKSYYLYFTVEDQKKINDFLSAEFTRFFRHYMLIGDEYKIQKKVLLTSLISDLKLLDDTKLYENLKKSDYRNRNKMKQFVLKTVQSIVL